MHKTFLSIILGAAVGFMLFLVILYIVERPNGASHHPPRLSQPSQPLTPCQPSKPQKISKPRSASILARGSNSTEGCSSPGHRKQRTRKKRPRRRRIRHESQPDKKIAVESHTASPPDPLVAAARHNHQFSPLHQLPETILIRLLQVADPVTAECLRRTSRIFLRLFEKARPSQANKRVNPWATALPTLLDADQRKQLLELLAKDAYCDDCLAARQAPDWQTRVQLATERYLHCSGCDLDHPACLCTPEQRFRTHHERVCIGHHGYVRLCEHKTVSWQQLWVLGRKMRGRKLPCWEVVEKCEDPSHLRLCEWGAGPGTECPERYPTLRAGYDGKKSGLRVKFSWSAHLSLVQADKKVLTPESLRVGLAELHRKQAGFICPELERGQIVESRIFDPNFCSCLTYKGLDLPEVKWSEARYEKKKGVVRCHNGQTLPLQSLIQAQLREARRGPRKPDHVGDEARHWGDLDSSPAKGGPADGYELQVEALPCPTGAECLQLRCESEVRVDGKGSRLDMGSNWYLMLDPESYGVTETSTALGFIGVGIRTAGTSGGIPGRGGGCF